MEAVGDASGQLHLRDDLQVRRPRVHHHEPVLAGGLVVDVAHQVPVILVAVALDVVGHEERFAGEAPGPEVALRHGAVALAGAVEVELGHAADLGRGVADAEVAVPGVLDGEDVGRHQHQLLAAGLLPRVHRVHDVEARHLEPPHLRLVGGVARDHAEAGHLAGVRPHGRAAAHHHVHGLHHDLDLREDGVPLGDGEVVQERRLLHGEDGHVGALVAGRVEPEVRHERRHGAVAEREELAGDGVLLGVRGHAHDEAAAEVAPAVRGHLAGVRVDAHGVGEVGLAERVEAAGEVGEAGVGEPDALQRIHLPGQDPGRHDGAARHPGHAVEAGEDVGQDGRAGVALHEVLVRLHVARAQDGVVAGRRGRREEEGVQHAVAVEQVVRPAREVLRVGPVADVGAAGEAARDGAAHDGAGRRRQLVHGHEVAGQHVPRVHRRPKR
ncbi:Os02g0704131, partial [Oryza sativa Japonica Group]